MINPREVLPVTRSKSEARDNYDRLSRFYDLLTAKGERPFRDSGLGLLGPVAGESILEIGPGTGHGLRYITGKVGGDGRVFGLDISPQMLKLCRQRLEKEHFRSDLLILGDAAALPYPAAIFDAVFMCFTLELMGTGEIETVLAECDRVLRREGRIVVVSLSRAGKMNYMTRLYEWGHMKLPKLLDCRPIYAAAVLNDCGFQIEFSDMQMYWGMPVEIVLGRCV